MRVFTHEGPGFPQFREKLLIQGRSEIGGAAAAAGPPAHPDGPLHHLNVPRVPGNEQFIELRQSFTDVNPIAVPPSLRYTATII